MARSLLVVLILLSAVPAAFAQTGPSLLLKPWSDDSHVEAGGGAMILAGGGNGEDIRIYDGAGRARLDPADERRISFGADVTYIDLGVNDMRLVDQSVGAAMGLWRFDSGWELGSVFAVGYAGNNPFADGTAVYFKGDLILSKKLDDRSGLMLLLDYNGNRTIFPDVPLPAIAYSHKVSDEFWFSLGVPNSSIDWKPLPQVDVNVQYSLPYTIDVTATWQVIQQLALFAGFHNRYQGFFIDHQRREERTFFRQRSVEGGVTWSPCENCDVSVAGGYAFDQQLETGFDARNTDTVAHFSSEPFLRAALEISF